MEGQGGPATLLTVQFNQDYGCFACGTTQGFRVHNCDPFKETVGAGCEAGGLARPRGAAPVASERGTCMGSE
jgi:hypothetical protein